MSSSCILSSSNPFNNRNPSGCKFVPFIFIFSLLITPFHPTRRRSAKLNGASNEWTERFKYDPEKEGAHLKGAYLLPLMDAEREHILSLATSSWMKNGTQQQLRPFFVGRVEIPRQRSSIIFVVEFGGSLAISPVPYYRQNWNFIYFGGK